MRLLAIVTLLWCVASSAAAADLSRIDVFLAETAFDELQVSPDGAQLAFLTRANDWDHDREVFTVWRLALGTGHQNAAPVKLAELGSCSTLRWAPDSHALSFLSTAADGGLQLFLLDLTAAPTPRPLTTSSRFPEGVDLYEWLPDGAGFILEATDPAAGETATQHERRALDGDVRRLPALPSTASLLRLRIQGGQLDRLGPSPFEEPGNLAVSADGKWLAVSGGGHRDTADTVEVALLELGNGATNQPARRTHNLVLEDRVLWAGRQLLATGKGEDHEGRYAGTEKRLYRVESGSTDLILRRIAPAPEGGIDDLAALANGTLLTATLRSTGTLVSLLDPLGGTVRTLREERGWIRDISASASGNRIAFVLGDARHFAEIYVADGLDQVAQARRITHFNDDLSAGPLPEIETVAWEGDDGVKVEGVVFWPPGRKGEAGLPLIVDLHGGPFGIARSEALDLTSSASYPSLLAARGFLVLNPNYRGSGGRGDAFTRAIEGHRCSRPSGDVIRGVENLVARGWADRNRVGLIGYSGGGGLSKCLIGRTDLFRAAATGAGDWDDISIFGTVRGAAWSEVFYEGKLPWDNVDLWWKESPIGGLGRVKTPTLIVAGERDGTSPGQAAELYHDLVWRNIPAELLVFPGEPHLFTKPSHKRTKMREELSWLEHYVLGKPLED